MKTLNLSIDILDGEQDDIVVVIAGDKRVSVDVHREPYVEERWGRYHNAKSAARRIVSDTLLHWDFPS